MLLPGRHANTSDYRYGFNGKEKDDEIKGSGLHYDYGFRVYDPRLGKFLSTDPLTRDFPWYTPYQFAGNKPIVAVDLDGLEELDYRILENLNYGDIMIDMSNAPEVFELNGKKYYSTLNAFNETRNPQYYFTKALEQAPDWWSAENAARIRAGEMPHPDDTFLKKLGKNLDEADFALLKDASLKPKTRRKLLGMEHHHIDHGKRAIALPWKVHRGKGNTKFWHRFARGAGSFVRGTKKIVNKVPVAGALISLTSVTAGESDPATEMIGISSIDYEGDTILFFQQILDTEELSSAVETLSGFPQFSIYYATLSETRELLETGRLPDGDFYSDILETTHELDFYYGKIAPYMLIFYDDELIKILETPQDPENDPGRG